MAHKLRSKMNPNLLSIFFSSPPCNKCFRNQEKIREKFPHFDNSRGEECKGNGNIVQKLAHDISRIGLLRKLSLCFRAGLKNLFSSPSTPAEIKIRLSSTFNSSRRRRPFHVNMLLQFFQTSRGQALEWET